MVSVRKCEDLYSAVHLNDSKRCFGEHDFFKKNWNQLLKSILRLNQCREEMKRFAGELRSQMLMNLSLVSLQVQKTTAAQRLQLEGKCRLRLSVRRDQNQQG